MVDVTNLTQFPIGSSNFQVAQRNAGDLDKLLNSTATSVLNRAGTAALTIPQLYTRVGYEVPVVYAASILIERATQTVDFGGVIYAPNPSDLPFTTSGTFETAKFRVLQGVPLVNFGSLSVRGFATAALAKAATDLSPGDVVQTPRYRATGLGGGGVYLVQTAGDFGGTPDELSDFTLPSGDVLRLLEDGEAHILQYGAPTDGVTDIQPNWQAAMDKHKKVIFPDGTFKSTQVNPYSGQHLVAKGIKGTRTMIEAIGAISLIGAANADVKVGFNEINSIIIDGFAFRGVGASVVKTIDTDLLYCVEWEIKNCWFGWSMLSSLECRLLTSTVIDNRFGQDDGLGLHANHSHLVMNGTKTPVFAEINGTSVKRNRFDNAPAAGNVIRVDYGFDVNIDGNIFQNNATEQIKAFGISPMVIQNNYWEANTATHFFEFGTDTEDGTRWSDIVIRNNFFTQAAGDMPALANIVTGLGTTWVSFLHNYSTAASTGLQLTTSASGDELNVLESRGNFIRAAYAGDKANSYVNTNAHPADNPDGVLIDTVSNTPVRVKAGTLDTDIRVYSSKADIQALTGGTNQGGLVQGASNGHYVVGIRSDDINDTFSVMSNFGGAAQGVYDTLMFKTRADGLMTAPGVYNNSVADAANVTVNSSGLVRRSTSSRRWKTNERAVTSADLNSSLVYGLTPVKFDYKDKTSTWTDSDGVTQTLVEEGQKDCVGFIAEDSLAFASLDEQGLPDGINWNAITISLVEEIKKLKAQIDALTP
jgi:hypothetical protein